MKALSLSCGHCGAPLDVPETAKFVTCTYCSSRLAVRQSGGAVYTEVLQALEQRTEQIADDVELVKLQNQLDRLDREWMLEREHYKVAGRYGSTHLPTRRRSFIILAFMVTAIVAWVAISRHATVFFLGIVFLGVVIVMFMANLQKAGLYQRRLRQYERQREQIVRQLESRRS